MRTRTRQIAAFAGQGNLLNSFLCVKKVQNMKRCSLCSPRKLSQLFFGVKKAQILKSRSIYRPRNPLNTFLSVKIKKDQTLKVAVFFAHKYLLNSFLGEKKIANLCLSDQRCAELSRFYLNNWPYSSRSNAAKNKYHYGCFSDGSNQSVMKGDVEIPSKCYISWCYSPSPFPIFVRKITNLIPSSSKNICKLMCFKRGCRNFL